MQKLLERQELSYKWLLVFRDSPSFSWWNLLFFFASHEALAFTSVLPWTFCLVFYIILHWAFPYDRRLLEEEKEKCLERHDGRLYSDSEASLSDNEDDYLTYLN